MKKTLIAYYTDNVLAYHLSTHYDPEVDYTFLNMRESEVTDLLGSCFDDIILLEVYISTEEDKQAVSFLLSRQKKKDADEYVPLAIDLK